MSQPKKYGVTLAYPARIYHWLDTQLSIARFYGAIILDGERYVIAHNEEGQPLVRESALKRERDERKRKVREEKEAAQAAQIGIFEALDK